MFLSATQAKKTLGMQVEKKSTVDTAVNVFE